MGVMDNLGLESGSLVISVDVKVAKVKGMHVGWITGVKETDLTDLGEAVGEGIGVIISCGLVVT